MVDQFKIWPLDGDFEFLVKEPRSIFDIGTLDRLDLFEGSNDTFFVHNVKDDHLAGTFLPFGFMEELTASEYEDTFSSFQLMGLVVLGDKLLVGRRHSKEKQMGRWVEFLPHAKVGALAVFGGRIDYNMLMIKSLEDTTGIDSEAVLVSQPFAIVYQASTKTYVGVIKLYLDESAPLAPLRVGCYEEYHWIEERKLGAWMDKQHPSITLPSQAVLGLIQ